MAESFVFISYAHAESKWYVERLAQHLAGLGITAWYDREIVSGDRWTHVIRQRLDACAAVVVVMTPGAEQSTWVGREIIRAERLRKPVLPLLLTGEPLFALEDLQHEDVRDGQMPGSTFTSRLTQLLGGVATPAHRAEVLPVYLIADVSFSMDGPPLDAMNALLPTLATALMVEPDMEKLVRIAMIDFADDARVVFPLTDMSMYYSLPRLTARGGTGYAAAFRRLRQALVTDTQRLRAEGIVPRRPVVWFLTDGEPTDMEPEWRRAVRAVTAGNPSPDIIPFGFAAASARLLQLIAHPDFGPVFFQVDGVATDKAIRAATGLIVGSILDTARGMRNGSSDTVLPRRWELPAGIVRHG